MTRLYRKTVHIWTTFDPDALSLEMLAYEASQGSGIAVTDDAVPFDLRWETSPDVPEGVLSFFENEIHDDEDDTEKEEVDGDKTQINTN